MIRFEFNKQKERLDLRASLKKLEKIISKEFKKSGLISVAFVDKKTIKALNRHYRAKDKTTDILTFVLNENDYLGEILLSYKDIEKRSLLTQKTPKETAIYLIVHGVCHIFGYTHKKKDDTRKMELKEKEILKQL